MSNRTYTWPTLEGLPRPDLLRGPVCEEMHTIGGCWHESCALLVLDTRIRLAEGPVCDHLEFTGECPHSSCLLVEPPQGDCRLHGWQLVLSEGSGSGFAGGRIYWAELACGCTDMDEHGDLEAAR